MPLKDKEKKKEYNRKWREKNPKWYLKYKNKYNKHNKKKYKEKKEFMLSLKKGGCILCGWNEHPEILQHHHINPKEKTKEMSQLFSKKSILEESKKCILLCPNCHMWHHYPKDES